MQVGDKVTYVAAHSKGEHGIVKSINHVGNIFVVYNCGGNWDQYQDYTAAWTNARDLVPGWIELPLTKELEDSICLN